MCCIVFQLRMLYSILYTLIIMKIDSPYLNGAFKRLILVYKPIVYSVQRLISTWHWLNPEVYLPSSSKPPKDLPPKSSCPSILLCFALTKNSVRRLVLHAELDWSKRDTCVNVLSYFLSCDCWDIVASFLAWLTFFCFILEYVFLPFANMLFVSVWPLIRVNFCTVVAKKPG